VSRRSRGRPDDWPRDREGRWEGVSRRGWVYDLRTLPVGRLVRSTPDVAAGVLRWPASGAAVGWRRRPGELWIRYRCQGVGHLDYFDLSGHTPGLGGEVVLPHCSGCAARVRFLFLDLALGGFRCRKCCGLRYRSQYDGASRRRWPSLPRRWLGADEPWVEIAVDGNR
jgi:hypothetical protein